jgi:hypothetical protein
MKRTWPWHLAAGAACWVAFFASDSVLGRIRFDENQRVAVAGTIAFVAMMAVWFVQAWVENRTAPEIERHPTEGGDSA